MSIKSIGFFVKWSFVLCLVFAGTLTAFADHSEEEVEESHATTVSVTGVTVQPEGAVTITPTYTSAVDVARIQKMQQLLSALQELVALLKLQQMHLSEAHDEHSDDDHE